MTAVHFWGAGTTRRFAAFLALSVVASLVMLQQLSVRAGAAPEASWRPALAGTALVLAAALACHLMIGRRRRYTPVPESLLPLLERLTASAGLTRGPEFVVNPYALTTGAVTLGRMRRYRVVLDAGLVCRSERTPGRLTAVVLHELAHVRNRDVEVAQFAVTLWRVTSVAVLLPYAVVNVWSYFHGSDPAAALRNAEFALAVSAVLYLMYAEILRTRELYADMDAVFSGANSLEWAEPDSPVDPRTGWGELLLLGRLVLGKAVTACTTLLRTHPTPGQRRRALEKPGSWAAASMIGESLFAPALSLAAFMMVGLLLTRRELLPGGLWEWPGLLTASVTYSAAVACLSAVLISPDTRFDTEPVGYIPLLAGHRRGAAWTLGVLFTAITALLFATDPMHYRSDNRPSRLELPYIPISTAPITWVTTQSEAVAQRNSVWLASSSTAHSRLLEDLSRLLDKIKETPPRHIDWPSFEANCVAVSQDVDALDALGSFPHVEGRQPWAIVKDKSRTAIDLLCHHRYTPRAFQPLIDAAKNIGQEHYSKPQLIEKKNRARAAS